MKDEAAEVVCMGEMLIDFVSMESGVKLVDASTFQRAPGGAPANVAVGLARLGVSCAFVGKVGDEDFGRYLAGVLEQNGVGTRCLRYSKEARTALAFVSLRADGERDFMFYRHPSADMLLTAEEVDLQVIRAARIFHFGSITLIREPARSATLHAAEAARQAGVLVSYDPNLRLSLWPDAEAARAGMLAGWPYANIVKVSAEELAFLAQVEGIERAARKMWHEKLALLMVTKGPLGCDYFTASHKGHVPGFEVTVVDTTGAGDGFVAGVLTRIVRDKSLLSDPDQLQAALRYANAVGALTTTRRGAIPALPTRDQVEALLSAGR